MLRGAQTPGELKQRTERYSSGFADLAAVNEVLERLIDRGFVIRHPRRPGQKEDRYEQVLGGDDAVELVPGRAAVDLSGGPGRPRGRPDQDDRGRGRREFVRGRRGPTPSQAADEDGAARPARSRPARPQRRDREAARGARRLAAPRAARGAASGRPALRWPPGIDADHQARELAPFGQQLAAAGASAAGRSGASSRRSGGRCAGRSSGSRRGSAAALWRRGVATL